MAKRKSRRKVADISVAEQMKRDSMKPKQLKVYLARLSATEMWQKDPEGMLKKINRNKCYSPMRDLRMGVGYNQTLFASLIDKTAGKMFVSNLESGARRMPKWVFYELHVIALKYRIKWRYADENEAIMLSGKRWIYSCAANGVPTLTAAGIVDRESPFIRKEKNDTTV